MKEKLGKKGIVRKLFSVMLALAMVLTVLPLNKLVANAAAAPTPLTFTAEEAGSTVKFSWVSGSSVEYSTDGGSTWSSYTADTTITLTNAGDTVSFKGTNVKTKYDKRFYMTGKIAASGDVTSLTNGIGGDAALTSECYWEMFCNCTSLTSAPALPSTTLADSCYQYMFQFCSNLSNAPALPATSLAKSCYESMFHTCTSLTSAPALPATSLANECYESMFYKCTSLSNAPALPATTLADSCYSLMFEDCTNLTSTPALPATTLASRCYYLMFGGCTSLTSAPALPATTLASRCYASMFKNCTNLSSAPALPATTLTFCCYSDMFSGCTNLTSAPALPATTLANSCYSNMFTGCTSLLRAPALLATTLANGCYDSMFKDCTNLSSAPALPATTLVYSCYSNMFAGCTNLIVTETTNAPEATWIFPSTAASYWNYEMITGLTAPGTLTDVEGGKMYKVSYVVPLPTPVVPSGDNNYNETIAETNAQLEAVAEELAKGEKVEDATVYLTTGDSLPLSVLKTLKNCPGVTLDFRCIYKGEELHFVLKGGEKLVINENISWYGPLFLKSVYGVVVDEKDTEDKTPNTGVYLIKRGDSLFRISRGLGISIADLLKKNPQIKNPNRIWAGQLLNY